MTRRARGLPPAVRLFLIPLALLLTGATLPKHPPAPTERPDRHAVEKSEKPKADKPGEPKAEETVPDEDIPVPTKPPASAKDKEEPAGADENNEDTEGTPEPEQKPEPEPVPGIHEDLSTLSACYTALDKLGAVYEKKETINDAGRCGIEDPVSVTKILPDISLKPANEMRCATALALARWTKRVVEPAAEELGKGVQLTGLAHGSAYVCKHRDSIETRKISEHAFGNAVDIVTFDFKGHDPLSIAPRQRTGTIEESFQKAVIGGACLYFTTVLGPRADEFHQDNLHLDVIERSHGFRLCQ